jgi:transcriptional regulator with XRE-family HTH domain
MLEPKEIAEKIQVIAKSQGKNVSKILETSNLDKSTVYNMKRGQMPAADKLFLIAKSINTTVDALLENADTDEVTNLKGNDEMNENGQPLAIKTWRMNNFVGMTDELFNAINQLLRDYNDIFGDSVMNKSVLILPNDGNQIPPKNVPFTAFRRYSTFTEDCRIYIAPLPDLYKKENIDICSFIFQLSHEICHFVMNTYSDNECYNWISECLCDCASLFFMKRMPQINGKVYVDEILASVNTNWSHNNFDSISSYYEQKGLEFSENIHGPIANGYRWRNTYIASKLLPTLENNPDSWKAIINMGSLVNRTDYFIKWITSLDGNDALPKAFASLLGLPDVSNTVSNSWVLSAFNKLSDEQKFNIVEILGEELKSATAKASDEIKKDVS